jgi:hypothetical protein
MIRDDGGSWTGQVSVDEAGLLRTVFLEPGDGDLRLTAEGSGGMFRIIASMSGSKITGSWVSSGEGGRFLARKSAWTGSDLGRAF